MVEFSSKELNMILSCVSDAEAKAAKSMSYMPERYERTKALWNKVYKAYREAEEREGR